MISCVSLYRFEQCKDLDIAIERALAFVGVEIWNPLVISIILLIG